MNTIEKVSFTLGLILFSITHTFHLKRSYLYILNNKLPSPQSQFPFRMILFPPYSCFTPQYKKESKLLNIYYACRQIKNVLQFSSWN